MLMSLLRAYACSDSIACGVGRILGDDKNEDALSSELCSKENTCPAVDALVKYVHERLDHDATISLHDGSAESARPINPQRTSVPTSVIATAQSR